MSQSLDIFVVELAGDMWIASAKTLIEAMTIVGNRGPGKYLVFCQESQEKSYYNVSLDGKVSAIENVNGGV